MKPPAVSGNFLRADNVKDGDIIFIKNEGEVVTSTKFAYPNTKQDGSPHPFAGQMKPEFRVEIELMNGEAKTLTMNSTSQKNLFAVWGDSSNWVDKQAKITKALTANGKFVIILTPIIPEEQVK